VSFALTLFGSGVACLVALWRVLARSPEPTIRRPGGRT
jgi:hypothetical protein